MASSFLVCYCLSMCIYNTPNKCDFPKKLSSKIKIAHAEFLWNDMIFKISVPVMCSAWKKKKLNKLTTRHNNMDLKRLYSGHYSGLRLKTALIITHIMQPT